MHHMISTSLLLALICSATACIKRKAKTSDISAVPDSAAIYEGYGTDFEKLGEPYGGCGVPESLLFDENGKKLPYIALNVQNTAIAEAILPRPILDPSKIGLWKNGNNCGRWIEITVGNDCRSASQQAHEGKICVQQDGSFGPEYYKTADELNGKVIYGVIADSCQDPNYWCRDSRGHVDISTHELLEMLQIWGSDRAKWNNRQVSWKFLDQVPSKFTIGEPKFAWAQNAMPYWPALVIYNLKNGLSKVEIEVNGAWAPAQMNSDMGQLWILGGKDNSRDTAQGHEYRFRLYDSAAMLLGTYAVILPTDCEKGCKDVLKVKSGGLTP